MEQWGLDSLSAPTYTRNNTKPHWGLEVVMRNLHLDLAAVFYVFYFSLGYFFSAGFYAYAKFEMPGMNRDSLSPPAAMPSTA